MPLVIRAVLWVLMVIAPGGVFLLPLLVGDEVARRRREARTSKPDGIPVRAAGAVDRTPVPVPRPCP